MIADNKLRIPILPALAILFIFSTGIVNKGISQTSNTKLPVTNKWKTYRQQVAADSSKQMIELKSAIPGIVYDLRYATKNNFVKKEMYASNTRTTYVRLPVARALQKVQKDLEEKNLGLMVFDAYRPYSVTVQFWELIRDDRYVANPAKGSGHNRGIAIDLTLIDLKTGKPLNMGTDFDNFTDTARPDFKDLPKTIIENRTILRSTMEKNGFKVLDTEWWHFYIPESSKYEILDISFKTFSKKQN